MAAATAATLKRKTTESKNPMNHNFWKSSMDVDDFFEKLSMQHKDVSNKTYFDSKLAAGAKASDMFTDKNRSPTFRLPPMMATVVDLAGAGGLSREHEEKYKASHPQMNIELKEFERKLVMRFFFFSDEISEKLGEKRVSALMKDHVEVFNRLIVMWYIMWVRMVEHEMNEGINVLGLADAMKKAESKIKKRRSANKKVGDNDLLFEIAWQKMRNCEWPLFRVQHVQQKIQPDAVHKLPTKTELMEHCGAVISAWRDSDDSWRTLEHDADTDVQGLVPLYNVPADADPAKVRGKWSVELAIKHKAYCQKRDTGGAKKPPMPQWFEGCHKDELFMAQYADAKDYYVWHPLQFENRAGKWVQLPRAQPGKETPRHFRSYSLVSAMLTLNPGTGGNSPTVKHEMPLKGEIVVFIRGTRQVQTTAEYDADDETAQFAVDAADQEEEEDAAAAAANGDMVDDGMDADASASDAEENNSDAEGRGRGHQEGARCCCHVVVNNAVNTLTDQGKKTAVRARISCGGARMSNVPTTAGPIYALLRGGAQRLRWVRGQEVASGANEGRRIRDAQRLDRFVARLARKLPAGASVVPGPQRMSTCYEVFVAHAPETSLTNVYSTLQRDGYWMRVYPEFEQDRLLLWHEDSIPARTEALFHERSGTIFGVIVVVCCTLSLACVACYEWLHPEERHTYGLLLPTVSRFVAAVRTSIATTTAAAHTSSSSG